MSVSQKYIFHVFAGLLAMPFVYVLTVLATASVVPRISRLTELDGKEKS